MAFYVRDHHELLMQSCKDIPAVKDMLATAQKVLGYDLLKLCLEGPKEKLDDTAYRCEAPHSQVPEPLLHRQDDKPVP